MYVLLDTQNRLVDGKPIRIFRKPKAIILRGYQYPKNWMQTLTIEEKNQLNIWPLTTESYDKRMYRETGEDYTYYFDGKVVIETIPVELDPEALNRYIEIKRERINNDCEVYIFSVYPQPKQNSIHGGIYSEEYSSAAKDFIANCIEESNRVREELLLVDSFESADSINPQWPEVPENA